MPRSPRSLPVCLAVESLLQQPSSQWKETGSLLTSQMQAKAQTPQGDPPARWSTLIWMEHSPAQSEATPEPRVCLCSLLLQGEDPCPVIFCTVNISRTRFYFVADQWGNLFCGWFLWEEIWAEKKTRAHWVKPVPLIGAKEKVLTYGMSDLVPQALYKF